MKRFFHFIQYHNAALVILVVVFGAATSVFAASETARDSVYQSEEKVVSIDNTLLLATNLEEFDYNVVITSVKTDDEFYYIEYQYNTIELIDNVWQVVPHLGFMKPSHRQLLGQDLGLFVATQIGEVIGESKRILTVVKDREETRGESRIVIATEYGGLIGKFFDTKTRKLPGYVPVVKEKEKPAKEKVTAGPSPSSSKSVKREAIKNQKQIAKAAEEVTTILDGTTRSAVGAPRIELLGNNPARIVVGSSYLDLGARIFDDKDEENLLLGWLSAEGAKNLDTSTPATFEIIYTVTDTDGNTARAVRVVEVYDQYASTRDTTSGGGGDTTNTAILVDTTATSTNTTAPETANTTDTTTVDDTTGTATTTDTTATSTDTTAPETATTTAPTPQVISATSTPSTTVETPIETTAEESASATSSNATPPPVAEVTASEVAEEIVVPAEEVTTDSASTTQAIPEA
ncbi:MAG: DUF5011 domain-containing protein [bacterium]|nr:DUF5011 domain-containing protein [bacterium]